MLKFELNLDEANLVLAALAKAPFEQVAGLIGKFREQAQPQLPALEAAQKAAQEAAQTSMANAPTERTLPN
jgi:hypothetical protein